MREGEVVVIGGGVMGMLTALQLAPFSGQVTLLERQQLGAESSWAGGGIVSPLYPWRYSSAVGALAHWSQDFYPQLGQQLAGETGIDPQVRMTGLYWLDLEDEASALAWGAGHGRTFERLSGVDLRQRMPMVAEHFDSALYQSQLANVRNPRLLAALRCRLEQHANVRIVETTEVDRLVPVDSGWQVCAAERVWQAPRVVVAAGAWSASLLASLGLALPVEPVKGQMILYRCAPDFLPSMVLGAGRYAIPREDGHILVGSTLEHVGFDKSPTADALSSLRASAEHLLPALTGQTVVGNWAGLRPGSPDGVPFIGEVSQYPGLWLNCGHYRNGLVLAPASCELLKNLMLGESPIVPPAPYAPGLRLAVR